jgi:septal ring factor EnvC (AmiA/AmiB activator)
MKLKKINSLCFLFFICCACSETVKNKEHCPPLSLKKNESKIANIKSRIERNKRIQDDAQKKIAHLEEKLFNYQISLINKKIENFKKNEKSTGSSQENSIDTRKEDLFLEERKMLTQIIENSEIYSGKAQVVLNEILEIITKLND